MSLVEDRIASPRGFASKRLRVLASTKIFPKAADPLCQRGNALAAGEAEYAQPRYHVERRDGATSVSCRYDTTLRWTSRVRGRFAMTQRCQPTQNPYHAEMHTFAVSDVPVANQLLEPIALDRMLAQRLPEPLPVDLAVDRLREARRAGRRPGPLDHLQPVTIEACGSNHELVDPRAAFRGLKEPPHALIEAVHTAFAEHYPLVLSPDDVWLCLAQGFALHVEANAEALRSRFVRHEGQLTLEVRRDDFVKGSPHNDWLGCFAEWSDAIAAHIGKKRDLVVAAFSTTGPIERAASEIVLMSAMKNYFNFLLMTLCGIPSITLLGTVEDWQAISHRAEVFAEFGLTDWVRALLPVLDQFVKAAAGEPDREFWRSIYKYNDERGSSDPYVTGWINVLFPYLDSGGSPMGQTSGVIRNDYAFAWSRSVGKRAKGPTIGRFPRGLSRVPLTWECRGTTFPMTLQAGFVGIAQDRQTRAVQPAIGWAVHIAESG